MDTGELKGKVTGRETGVELPFVNISLEQNGKEVAGGSSDFVGQYKIGPIAPGKYTLKSTFTGYKPAEITEIVINAGRTSVYDLELTSTVINAGEF
ncbi:MAG: carboxypeptidase regulatory-like domain-containing protein [Crocinitomicaceae bacterium]|nr:carboxypeptidase regulatory-like domain-containing protein [Crocinitomicaceae bacterium]